MDKVYISEDNFLQVTNKLLTIVGEVENPGTVRVPLGTSLREAVDMAGGEKKGIRTEELVYFVGGPMMGKIGSPYEVVTKTTNAILVLPSSHMILQKKQTAPSLNLKRAASACCQCRTCTDLCPRHNLGHPIEPHKFMQAVSNHDVQDMNTFLDLFFCSGCGLCEMFSCPQSLSPRSLIAECKNGLRQAGIKPTKCEADDIKEAREYRKVPENRLEARLGLSKYETDAPLENQVQGVKTVRIPLLQHIGAPATSIVTKGSHVLVGQMIAKAAEGLSVPIHASIEGIVIESNDNYIEIEAIS